jgi:hypothetical protein
MEREACLRPVAPGGWMSGLKLAAAKKPGPTQHRSSHIQGFSSAGVCCLKLSKLLNQGDALSAPCFSRAPSRGAPRPAPRHAGAGGMPRTGLTRHFRCHITVCYTQLITPTSADELPVVGGRCTGGAHRCKVKQRSREDRAGVWILTSKVVRFGGRVQSEKK